MVMHFRTAAADVSAAALERVPHWVVFTTVFTACACVFLMFKLQRIERYLHCAVADRDRQVDAEDILAADAELLEMLAAAPSGGLCT
jgi:hypothetical protein